MLLIANLHDIRCTSLSGSASRLPSIPTKQTVAMDFIYAEETVCWIDVGETPATTHLKCANIPDLKNVANIRTINISLSLHREWPALFVAFAFVGNNVPVCRRDFNTEISACFLNLNLPKSAVHQLPLVVTNLGCSCYFLPPENDRRIQLRAKQLLNK